MRRGTSFQKWVNQRTAVPDVDVNIVHKLLTNCGGANCLSGRSAFIAKTRLNEVLAEITPTSTPALNQHAVDTAERPMFLASEIWSLIMLCKGLLVCVAWRFKYSLPISRFVPFSRWRDRTNERASGRAKERAWGEQENGERWGGGEREGGGDGGKIHA